ncbi:hypothetical protein GIB67_029188 [Kingdonia uniflora]|uniref:Zinc finger CCCH domain-containing protein 19 n=1 Tax=Kingdonia uniflora TaxID=39325 RepID=A0A7J7LS52_9MAGN|nr:hypothetical protein GIB67_029188 [Kingdonia uniflora]
MEEDDEGLGFHTPQQDFIDEKKKQCEVAPEMVDYDVFKPQIDDDSRGGETYMSVSNSLSVEGEPSIVEQRCEQVSIQRDDSGDEKPSNAEVVPEIEVSHVEETLTVEQRRDSIEQPEVVSEIEVSHLDVEEELVQLGDEIEIEIGDYEVEELIDVFESVEVSTDINNDSQVHRITNVLEFEGLHEIGDSHFEVSHSVRIDAAADDEEGAPKDLEGTFSVQRFEVLSQIGHSHVEESPGVHAGEEGDLPKVLEGGMNVQSFEDCPMVYDDETDIVVDKDDALKELEETSSVQQFKVSPIVHDDETNAPKYLEETLNAQQLEVSPMVHDDGPGIVADKKDVLKDLEGVSNIQQFKVLPQIGDSQGEKPENVQKSEVAPMVDADEADVVADKEDGQKDLDGTSVQQLEVLPQIGDSQVEEPLNARQEEVSPMVDATVDNEEKEAPKDSFKVQVIGVLEESTAIVEGVSPMDIEENVPVEPRAQESETLLQVEEIYVEKPTDIQQFVVSPMAEDEDKKNVLKDPPNAQEVEVLPRTGDEDELSNKAVEENVLVEPSTVSQFEALPEAGVSKESTVSNEVSARVEKENVPDEALDAQGFKAPETEDSHVVEEEISPMVEEEDALLPDVEMDSEVAETEGGETSGGGIGKRKRGRPAKAQIKTPPPKKKEKKEEEDVCFICFDGGNLVLCDRRGCPKAYHPTCVNRDEAFFRSKGRWNCGWHLCSICEKAAHYMCYTCTYSLCKGCIKEAEFYCVRGSKGFCETCMRTVRLIEKNEQGDKTQVNFNDKNSWEYLFKEYWIDLKRKLSMTLDELSQARNPWNGSAKVESSDELYDGNNDHGSNSDSSSENIEVISNTKKRKGRKQSKLSKEVFPSVVAVGGGGEGTSTSSSAEWASKDLLEFVSHMKKGDTSVLSQFDVQALLLEYIKQNNLRDPRKKSQIVCDSRLENLFGKARVGHFEMLKLLESHFLIKEDSQADDTRGEIVDTESSQLEVDGGSDSLKKRRKSRKKGDERLSQTNLDEYAAINVHNIHLLYLRRNLMEDLLDDSEKFHDRVVGSFVRIRISGSGQKHDMYRLVQVVGTRKVPDQYKTGKRSTDIVLEIVNLSKTESISIDTVSNQDFSEDECMRLRQSIKCGLISRMTVGELQEKAIVLQEVRVNDWLETEKLRLSNLRDRASDRGRRKEYPFFFLAGELLQILFHSKTYPSSEQTSLYLASLFLLKENSFQVWTELDLQVCSHLSPLPEYYRILVPGKGSESCLTDEAFNP